MQMFGDDNRSIGLKFIVSWNMEKNKTGKIDGGSLSRALDGHVRIQSHFTVP
jgi:hypothetical protein